MKEQPSDKKQIELTPAQVRSHATRRIVGFVCLFSILLAGAIWMVVREENQRMAYLEEDAKEQLRKAAQERYNRPRTEGELVTEPVTTPFSTPAPAAGFSSRAAPVPLGPELMAGSVPEPEVLAVALAHIRAATQALKNRDYVLTEMEARKALTQWPAMPDAFRILGLLYLMQGRFPEAIQCLETTLSLSPDQRDALSNLALAYFQMGNAGRAIELTETHKLLYPDDTTVLLQEGLFLLASKRFSEAEVSFRRALEVYPQAIDVRNNLAVVLIRKGDYEAAREETLKILETSPEYMAALFNIAITYAKEGNTSEAMSWLTKAVETASPEELTRYLRDRDLDALRETDEFKQLMQSVFPPAPVDQWPLP